MESGWIKMRGWLLLALLCACGRQGQGPAQLYQQSAAAYRRGEYTQVLERTAEALKSFPRGGEWYWRFRILRAEAVLTARSSKEAATLLEESPPAEPQYESLHVRRLVVLARLSLRARAPDFQQRLADARSRAQAADDLESLCDLDSMEGQWYSGRKEWDKAEAAFRATLRCSSYHQAVGWGNLGFSHQIRSRYDEALLYHQRAYAAAQRADAQGLAAVSLGNQSVCAYSLGNFDRALDLRRQSFEVQKRLGDERRFTNSLGELGTIHLFLGDLRKAVDYYQQALDSARSLKADDMAAFWAGNMAGALIELGDWDPAETWNREAGAWAKRNKDETALLYATLNEGSIARGRGRPAEAVRLFEQVANSAKNSPALEWEARAALGELHVRSADYRRADREFRLALGLIETRREELARAEYKITFLTRLIRFYQDFVDALIAQGRNPEALTVADSSRARMLVAQGRSRSYGVLRTAPGEVILAYWLAPKASYVWAISPSGLKLFRLPPKNEIESLAEAHQGAISALRDPLAEASDSSLRLSAMLLAPVRELIPPGTRVILIPDGALHGINFESLPSPHAQSRYWIEDVTLTIAPSLSALSRTAKAAPKAASLLLIGDPVSVDPSFPALPHAAREIDSVKKRMGAFNIRVYRGDGANPEVLRAAAPEQYRWIHFTAHASANRESPLDSAVILSPREGDATSYKLYARDVMDTPLEAELVTVSACRGAGARAYAGEGLVGFAWAFLLAGAGNVIAGIWDVTDASTSQLMDTLYAGIAGGKPPAVALREAKLALIRGGGNYAKPYYWAPFQIYTRDRHNK